MPLRSIYQRRFLGKLMAIYFAFGALGDVARAKGMSQIAKDTGLSRESLYRSLSEKGNPELSTVMKVFEALGLRLAAVQYQ